MMMTDCVEGKEAWWITRLEKVSGCLRTLESLRKKARGTYQNGNGTLQLYAIERVTQSCEMSNFLHR